MVTSPFADRRRQSLQGTRVQQELEELRSKHLARQGSARLKDISSPLTSPEQAHAFLAAMRDKQHEREVSHLPPTNLSSAGLDAWYVEQKQREKELRKRRKEAEALLRGYRGFSLLSPTGSVCSYTYLDTPLADPRQSESRDVDMVESKESNGSDNRETLMSSAEPKKFFKAASSSGAKRTATRKNAPVWRDFITDEPGAKYPPEAGRYHLYLSYACPGSHRVLIVRALKGLEDSISCTYLHPIWRLTNPSDSDDKHRGWMFGDPNGEPFSNSISRGGPFPSTYPGTDPDPHMNSVSIRQLYEHCGDDSGNYTIPMLWDTKTQTIVNNEASDIAYMLNSSLRKLAKNPDLDLYTEADEDGLAKLIEVTDQMAPLSIRGVYRCGFAKDQAAYDKAVGKLCAAFDKAEDILKRQRYLTGDTLTDADIRLFVTLIRFDECYVPYFRVNARLVMLSPTLLNFCRDIYQMSGINETFDMQQTKAHFFCSHPEWNKYSVIPQGLGFMEELEKPHNRTSLSNEGIFGHTAAGCFGYI